MTLPDDSISKAPTAELAVAPPPIDPTALLIDRLTDVGTALSNLLSELNRIYVLAVGINQPEMVALIRNHIAALTASVAQDADHAGKLAPTITALSLLAQARPIVPSLVSNTPPAWMMDKPDDTHPHAEGDPT